MNISQAMKHGFLAAAVCPAAFVSGWRSNAPAPSRAMLDETQDLLDVTDLVEVPDGMGGTNRTLRVHGVNVQVINGLGATNGNLIDPSTIDPNKTSVNGLGNVIVGWSESTGTTDRSGSHNLVIGARHSWPAFGGVTAGERGSLDGPYTSAVGGLAGEALEPYAAVSGGRGCLASGAYSGARGGRRNQASETGAVILGGGSELGGGGNAGGQYSVLVGGRLGSTSHDTSAVLGGVSSSSAAAVSAVLGGESNTTEGARSVVLGGSGRVTKSDLELIGDGQFGGDDDWTLGPGSLIAQAEYVGVGVSAPALALDAAHKGGAVMDARGDLRLGTTAAGFAATESFDLVSGGSTWRVGADDLVAEKDPGFSLNREGSEMLAFDGRGFTSLGATEAATGLLHLVRAAGLRFVLQGPFADAGKARWMFRAQDRILGELGFKGGANAHFTFQQGAAYVTLDPFLDAVRVGRGLDVSGSATLNKVLSCFGDATFGSLSIGSTVEPDESAPDRRPEFLFPITWLDFDHKMHAWGVVDKNGERVAGSPNWISTGHTLKFTEIEGEQDPEFEFDAGKPDLVFSTGAMADIVSNVYVMWHLLDFGTNHGDDVFVVKMENGPHRFDIDHAYWFIAYHDEE